MWNDIDERAVEIAEYAIATGKTVRAIAKKFGVSKSTVHTAVTIPNALCGWSSEQNKKRGIKSDTSFQSADKV